MNKLPKAKLESIVERDLGNELLIYNLTMHKAFTLNETLKIVYQSCDGKQTFADLNRKYQFTDDLIRLALDELKANNLLTDYESSHFAGLSRREVIRKVGLASIIALPVIAGITAPIAAHAASTCTPDVDISDPANGVQGSGEVCSCSLSGSIYQPCNTSRGGSPDPGNGCKQGCLCRVTNQQTQCNSNGSICNGGRCG